MTKQEQIEEMSRYICNACEMGFGGDFDGYCAEGSDYRTCGVCNDVAKAIYNEGYRKVPDGAKEEYERLNNAETELQELNIKYYNEAKDLRRELKQARNETAKEILQEVSKEVERVRLECEFQDESGKWLMDERDFISEFTLGSLYNLFQKYGVDFFEEKNDAEVKE